MGQTAGWGEAFSAQRQPRGDLGLFPSLAGLVPTSLSAHSCSPGSRTLPPCCALTPSTGHTGRCPRGGVGPPQLLVLPSPPLLLPSVLSRTRPSSFSFTAGLPDTAVQTEHVGLPGGVSDMGTGADGTPRAALDPPELHSRLDTPRGLFGLSSHAAPTPEQSSLLLSYLLFAPNFPISSSGSDFSVLRLLCRAIFMPHPPAWWVQLIMTHTCNVLLPSLALGPLTPFGS